MAGQIRIRLLWVLSKGCGEFARILQERDNANSDTTDLGGRAASPPPTGNTDESATPDNNQTQLLREVSEVGDNPNSDTSNPGSQELPPAPTTHRDEFVVEIQFQTGGPDADIADATSAGPGEQDRILDINHSISTSADNDAPSWTVHPASTPFHIAPAVPAPF
ncbi:hypothetical protein HOY80DRAFT_1004730 [Tuber brumale]|nr:hypothetical protein HOY80DRAFT_1004730 [Tuber brumale]